MFDFEDSIEKLKGIGPKKAEKLKTLGITKIKNFLFVFPQRYINLKSLKPIEKLEPNKKQLIFGKITNLNLFYTFRRRIAILNGIISDKTSSVRFQFFNQPYLLESLKGKEVFFYGKPIFSKNQILFQNPLFEYKTESLRSDFLPIYPEVAGFSSKQVRFFIRQILSAIKVFPEILPKNICQKFNLYSLEYTIKILHQPKSIDALAKAKKTWAILELLFFASSRSLFAQRRKYPSFALKKFNLKKYIEILPFQLTKDQKNALEDILSDLSSAKAETRLLNGDVGSGKTVVAFLAMINTVLNKKQAVLMAPTEILAYQHFLSFNRFFMLPNNERKFRSLLITNIWQLRNQGKKFVNLKKKEIAKAFKKADFIFGTHALLEEKIKIPKMALAVVDEQQRFGVKQRAILRRKNLKSFLPHLLMLTATPIPRTLAFVIFKDLKLSFLFNAPFARNTKTQILVEKERKIALRRISLELKKGNQIFVICPIISQKQVLNFDDRKAAEEEFKKIKSVFPEYKVGLLHGRMKSQEKERTIDDFKKRKTQILVSTSVVEVGVDIPKASVILVETAERFGLSQLHQLRGRIGRIGQASFCYFMTKSLNSARKLKILEKTTNGFLISQKDLEQRGPGEILGEKQHGFLKFRFANLFNKKLLEETQKILKELEKSASPIIFSLLK